MKLNAVGFPDERMFEVPTVFKADRNRWCTSISVIMQSAGIEQLAVNIPAVSGVRTHSTISYQAFNAQIPKSIVAIQASVAESLGELMAVIGIHTTTLTPDRDDEIVKMEQFWAMNPRVAKTPDEVDPGLTVDEGKPVVVRNGVCQKT